MRPHAAELPLLQATFKAFALPWEDFAAQWVAQPWSQIGEVHCNSYHSSKLRLLIMGDAAHAMSPSIGMGHEHRARQRGGARRVAGRARRRPRRNPAGLLGAVRVKEGNALSAIVLDAYSLSPAQQLRVTLAQLARDFLSQRLGPRLVAPDPINAIGRGAKLSEMYDELTRIGRLPAVRAVNDAERRRHFE